MHTILVIIFYDCTTLTSNLYYYEKRYRTLYTNMRIIHHMKKEPTRCPLCYSLMKAEPTRCPLCYSLMKAEPTLPAATAITSSAGDTDRLIVMLALGSPGALAVTIMLVGGAEP